MKKLISLMTLLTICTFSCNRANDTINKGGEVVGKTATEFIEGVSEGIDRSLECEINLSEDLIAQGLSTGKFSIEDSEEGGSDNMLVLYIIFDKDFEGELFARAFDKKGLEVGRAKTNVKGKAGDAAYFDFTFDQRTDIEVRSKIEISL